MRLPRVWWRDFGQHLAPNERRTFGGFWEQMETALENRISQRLGEAEQPRHKGKAA
jgi:hypothetical protein